MLKPQTSLCIIVSLWALFAVAQETPSETAKSSETQASDTQTSHARAAKKTPNPSPTPLATPKKRGILSRVFGSHEKATPEPSATPSATPSKTHRRKQPEKPAAESPGDSSGAAGEKREHKKEPESEKKAEAEKKPESEKKTEAGVTDAVEKKPGGEVEGADKHAAVATPAPSKKLRKARNTPVKKEASASSEAPVDPETEERNRFETAKTKALEDPQVSELKSKAALALTDEEGKKDLRAYNKALFAKMRKIDPKLKSRIDIMESVILKRLEE